MKRTVAAPITRSALLLASMKSTLIDATTRSMVLTKSIVPNTRCDIELPQTRRV